LTRTTRKDVTWRVEQGVARIDLDTAGQGLWMDPATAQGLCDAAEEIELDDRVSLVVLRGVGGVFCVGAPKEAGRDFVAAIAALTMPVVAAVNGVAWAEGCELALACDLRVASREASFCLPQIKEGRFPGHGATQRLPRIIGRTRAFDMLLSGRSVGASEAATFGLVSRVVPAARLEAVVEKEVSILASKGPIALRLAKEAVHKGMDMTLEQGIRLEQDLYVLLQTTADRAEGVRAFASKRRPKFKGR
jgi:enoyl-CoA hydratase/carnithine racemase